MFDQEFYPTPENIVKKMMNKVNCTCNILEPSAGKGDIVKKLTFAKNIYTYEKVPELAKIVSEFSTYKGDDFLKSIPQELSHIDTVIMNPPFSNAVEHILHAYSVCPEGTEIVALMNDRTYNLSCKKTQLLRSKVEEFGEYESLGDCFSNSERKTGVQVAMLYIKKPGEKEEFADFFSDEDDNMPTGDGIMQYDACREIVSRYIATIKTFDKLQEVGIEMQRNTDGIIRSDLIFTCKVDKKELDREEFIKELQKRSWKWILEKMNLRKFMTSKVYSQLNSKIEEYSSMKFTMKNIYILVDMIIQTQAERMNTGAVNVFEEITSNYHENRHNIEGWKTNKSYMVGRKFILPYCCEEGFRGNIQYNYHRSGHMDDMMKCFCYCMGYRYEDIQDFREIFDDKKFGEWFDWGMMEIKAFKKGTVHFKFKKEDDWIRFNKIVAESRGDTLPEKL